MIGSYPLAFGTTFQIIGMLRRQQLDGMSPNFINERNDLIQKVTLDDVNRVAKKLINPEHLTFIVVGKPDGIETGESK
jgi:zinc protease